MYSKAKKRKKKSDLIKWSKANKYFFVYQIEYYFNWNIFSEAAKFLFQLYIIFYKLFTWTSELFLPVLSAVLKILTIELISQTPRVVIPNLGALYN